MGKHAPVSEDQLTESCVFQRSCQVVIQKPLKNVYKASESVNVGAVDFVRQLEILEIWAKSLQQSRSRLFLVEAEELLYGDALPLCELLPDLLCRLGRASEDRIILESSSPRSLKSFELKVKRCIERGVVIRAEYAQKWLGQERIKCDRKCVWKQQSPKTKNFA